MPTRARSAHGPRTSRCLRACWAVERNGCQILCSDTARVVHGADDGFAAALRLEINSIRERGRGPPPFCLGGGGSRERAQPFRGNGKPLPFFTPTLRFFCISSI